MDETVQLQECKWTVQYQKLDGLKKWIVHFIPDFVYPCYASLSEIT